MSFLFKKKELTTMDTNKEKKLPFWKRKGWKIFFVIFGSVLLLAAAAISYVVITGSNVFIKNLSASSPFFKGAVSADQLNGEGDGRINILVTGMGGTTHPGGNLTDSIMVVSISPKDKTVAMLSIPRDLYVPVAGHNYSRKINEAYGIGESDKKGTGANVMKKTVGTVLDLPIHYFISIDFLGFKKIVDELGGLDINVEKTLSDPYYPDDKMQGYAPIYIKAGLQHMTGDTALKYARSRETSSDFDRASRQQVVLKGMKDKASKIGFLTNPKKIFDIVTIVGDHFRTDMTPAEIKSLLGILKDADTSKFVSKVLTDDSTGPLFSDSSFGTYYLKPRGGNFVGVQRIAHEIFTDPYLQQEHSKIQIMNASGKSGQAAELAKTLKSYGYDIISTETATQKMQKTTIYDYTNNQKPYTLNFLKKRLSAPVEVKAKPTDSNYDISIVLGADFNGME
ncbi:MAG: LCP family protein [Candidatus Berkelbacteria bacterium]